MLLELMRELGVNYDPYYYSEEWDNEDPMLQEEPQLDKIEVAGSISSMKLLAAAKNIKISILIAAMTVLATGFAPIMLQGASTPPVPKQAWRSCAQSLLPILMTLVAAGILDEVTETHLCCKCTCAFFLIKKSLSKMRLIYDGRPVNRHVLKSPPPVNIPHITEVLRRLHERPLHALILADYRHYFHQFCVPNDIKTFLGSTVKTSEGTRWFRAKTLPMGLSWSPFLAQAASLLMLIHVESGCPTFFRWTGSVLRLPQFLDVVDSSGEVVGFACFIYDNLCIALYCDKERAKAAEMCSKIEKRLLGNAKHFGAVFKELKIFEARGSFDILGVPKRDRAGKRLPSALPGSPDFYPIFLGVQIDPFGSLLRWRHSQKFVDKIAQLIGRRDYDTPRKIAKPVGMIIWDVSISFRRLSSLQGIISVLRTFNIKFKKDWDLSCVTPSSSWLAEVDLLLRDMQRNEWKMFAPRLEGPIILGASDASDVYIGGLIFHGDAPRSCRELTFTKSVDLATHIFVKEALALYDLIMFALLRIEGSFILRVAVDNIPVRRAFERGFTTNAVVNRFILRAYEALDSRSCQLQLQDICTSLNVADCLTRISEDTKGHNHSQTFVCQSRLEATYSVLKGHAIARPLAPKTSKLSSFEEFSTEYSLPAEEDWLVTLGLRTLDADF